MYDSDSRILLKPRPDHKQTICKTMKALKLITFGALIALLVPLSGCDSFLEEDVYSELAPGNFLTTREGMESLLQAAYAESMWGFGAAKYRTLHVSEWTTDLVWQTGGGENRAAQLMIDFTWDPSNNVGLMYNKPFDAIRNANVLLDNIDDADVPANVKEMIRAEARFIRALNYYYMYVWLGPVPLRTSATDPLELPRATEEEMKAFIEEELLAAIPNLPPPGQQPQYGRATNGAARGVLTKFYLNTKQWQKAADMAQEVMNMGAYSLYPDYFELFKAENERNSEFIWVDTAIPQGPGNTHMNATFPPGFRENPRTGLKWQNNWNNWASQYRLRDNFVESFEEEDERKKAIIEVYINAKGDTVNLANMKDNRRAFKYWPDPNANGNQHGNDMPRVRYADILLTRAEALNELNGLNAESVQLLNQVRERAGVDPMSMGDFNGKEGFRNHLIDERAWEFYYEGLRREDLIRWDKFIDFARARGISNAQPYHRLFPIVQSAIDANPALKQNPGY